MADSSVIALEVTLHEAACIDIEMGELAMMGRALPEVSLYTIYYGL